jgi:hypothetical protein
MPAPDRDPPIKIIPDSTRFPKGIVDYYSAAEVDALLAGLPSGVQSGVHEGPIPQPSAPTPQALEDAFVDFEDGLHYFKDTGSLVAITRQQYQTTITITGPTKSVAKIVKSDAGLPTPQNPSYLVQQEPDGKWMKLTSDEFNTPFGPPQMVDLFALTGGGTVDLSAYAKLTDATQVLTAQRFVGRGLILEQFLGGSARGNLGLADLSNGNDVRLGVSLDGKEPTQLAWLTDLASYYTKPEVDAKVAVLQQGVTDANLGVQAVADQIPFVAEQIGIQTEAKLALKADRADLLESIVAELSREPAALSNWMRVIVTSPDFTDGIRGIDHQHTMQDIPGLYSSIEGIGWKLDDRYTKAEVDAKLEADKDFSIANDNVLLASITSLQEVVSNLGEVGTGQIDVLDAIRDVEIEPSAIRLTGDAVSPIAWKGGLSLAPVKDGSDWRLGWNDGKNAHNLFHSDDFTADNIVAVLTGQDIQLGQIQLQTITSNNTAFAGDNGRIMAQKADGGPVETVAYLSDITAADLSGYAKVNDPAQMLTAKSVIAEGFAFSTVEVLKIHDTGEGYGPRLSYITVSGGQPVIDPVCLKSDLEPLAALLPRVEAVEAAQGLATGKLDIEDPVFAELKKSILDAVAKQAVGDERFAPPDDINWTGLRTGMFIQMMGGFIELKGIVPITKTSSGFVLATIPDRFPLPNADASYPVACREVGVAVRYGYITVSATSRDISFSPGGPINELTVNGIRFKAKWS